MGYDLQLTEEQEALIQTARDFTKNEITPVAGKYDESGEFPREILGRAWETGLLNPEVPEEYGGLGVGCFEHCLLLEEVAYGCLGFNTSMAGKMLASMPLLIAGTDEQKKKWLGRLIDEPVFAAYGCSEPDAGSDVASMTTKVETIGSHQHASEAAATMTSNFIHHLVVVDEENHLVGVISSLDLLAEVTSD